MRPIRLLAALAVTAATAPLAAQDPSQGDAAPDTAARNWHLLDPQTDRVPGTGAERAYRELLAGRQPRRQVVVAIIDSGVDTAHADLRSVLWSNARETAGNDRDDDGNGFVDDTRGWNFIGSRDGRHVNQDTYEVTRLYRALRPLYENAREDTLSAAGREQLALYRRVKADFDENRANAVQLLGQYRPVWESYQQAAALLRTHAGLDTASEAKVRAVQSMRQDVQRAREFLLRLYDNDLTGEQLREGVEQLESRVQYGYNPDFDTRTLVGDDPADPRERGYGNRDVFGVHADHGTHVAGIVAADRGNGEGIEGVAPTSHVRIMSLRTVPDGDERDKDVANAIRYAADNGAHIINMSFGKGYSPQKEVVDEAVRYAESKGVLMVHAAGNDGADLGEKPSFPVRTYLDGSAPALWLEVGASGPQLDELAASFSNWGDQEVDLFAPGVDILSTLPGGGYGRNSGTSMAAPVVSGVAALLMAYFPELTSAQVKQILLESATRYADLSVARPGSETERASFGTLSRTGGVVNAFAAVQMAERMVRGGR